MFDELAYKYVDLERVTDRIIELEGLIFEGGHVPYVIKWVEEHKSLTALVDRVEYMKKQENDRPFTKYRDVVK